MKRAILVLLGLILFFLSVGSVNPYPGKLKSLHQVDFSLIDSSLREDQQGIYRFTATVQNTGDPATTGTVPIPWEKHAYGLSLDNGMGSLDEGIADYDINGDGDKDDTFSVEWNNTIRPWDAEIDGVYVYAFCDHSVNRGFNRTYSIDGETKLFQIGSKTHSLYYACNDDAYFGFDAFVLNHPSPNFEFLVVSNVSVMDIEINGEEVEVDYTSILVEVGVDGILRVYTGLIIPNQAAIETDEQIEFSCTIIAHDTKTCDVFLLTNWSPNNNNRYRWIPFHQPDVSLEAINRPYFIPVDSDITSLDTDKKQLTSTIKNIGAPATTVAKVPVIWENLYYEFSLDNGKGTLDESITDYDINGDGDKEDTFDVSHEASANRPLDAIINGVHVHSILDQPQSPWYNLTFFIDGKSKLFQLGSETHALYMVNNEIAAFGLGTVLRNHPSPSFRLAYEAQNIDASDFKINGETVNVDYEETFEYDVYYEENRRNFTVCIIPDQASKISSNEIITFSCTFTASKTVTTEILLRMDWSPDNNIRYRSSVLFWQPDVEFEVQTSSTTSSTSSETSTTTSESAPTIPGFSFLTTLLIVVPVLIYKQKRKKN
ncbi:MAG: hypothetical protein ACFFB5_18805 [Promethearchaeota archaeon]